MIDMKNEIQLIEDYKVQFEGKELLGKFYHYQYLESKKNFVVMGIWIADENPKDWNYVSLGRANYTRTKGWKASKVKSYHLPDTDDRIPKKYHKRLNHLQVHILEKENITVALSQSGMDMMKELFNFG